MKKGRSLLLVAILLLGIGFAAVSTTLYINGDVNISANEEDFDVKFTKAVIDNEDKTSTAISADGKTITYTTKELQVLNDKSVLGFEITNNSALYDAEVSIECTSGEKGDYYQITKEVANLIPAKTTDKGSVEVQKIKMAEEDIEEAFTCTLVAAAKERTTKGEEVPKVNKNIVNSDLKCLQNKEVGSCAAGTEIRYMVNDTEEKTFNVLHDDGETMTLQEKDINSTKIWHSTAYNTTNGPLDALTTLDETTKGWSNVNPVNYIMGTTVFKDNEYTGCDKNSLLCTTNLYTLEQRSGKARMITFQEAIALGCSTESRSCPSWMYDGLSYPIDGYWTMSVESSSMVFVIGSSGLISTYPPHGTKVIRAVIEISK